MSKLANAMTCNPCSPKCGERCVVAVGGALVANIASRLSSIGDHRTRKQMRQLVDKELPRQIADRTLPSVKSRSGS